MNTTQTAPTEHVLPTTDDTEIRYRVAGSGPLLVLHPPGWGIGAAPYTATLGRLEERFTVVYLWPRGSCGVTTPGGSAPLDIPAFVSDLERLRTRLGADDFALAGHSHGGLIALHYALRYPDRVNSLVLLSAQLSGVPSYGVDPEPHATTPEPPEVTEAIRFLAENGGLGSLFEVRTDAEATEFLGRILPLYFADPTAMAPLAKALASLDVPHRTLKAVTASDADHPLPVEALRELDVPAVVVTGRHDRFCPVGQARGLAKLMPHTRLLQFERSGHFPWLEEPDAFFERLT